MSSNVTRRSILTVGLGAACVAALPRGAMALTKAGARQLVDGLVGEINRVIASRGSSAAMTAGFEAIFRQYGDVDLIARSTLGADANRASAAQMRAFTEAFRGYIARKYGKRFKEFVGGQIEVQGVRTVKSWYEVQGLVNLRGEAPFDVRFLVSDRSGRDLFFDMVIEGISLRLSERTEIGSMLDRRQGNIDALIADLRQAG
ncbi:phospholipid-binding protein MlaC [Roseovarius sp. M141]|uniref:MlaC/ttg2D family ABC transporter substrate-binding protein n=1 Tax=Roseovarius sp. M141 TaxID=2583806 RepID=UPI0020CF3AD9|nr:ABC transporter substrate-binding protein [Roseovarius sp. M141]MCQ0091133.1 ABC transporter substrate-binding protein [Roseovarius sp. M141]